MTPGPNSYVLPTNVGYLNHDTSRKRNPAYSIGIKRETKYDTVGPGPKYEICEQTRFGKVSSPKFTMRSKLKDPVGFVVPGPGTYAPEKCSTIIGIKPPSYSFGMKCYGENKICGPGPNAYCLPTCIGMKQPTNKTEQANSKGKYVSKKMINSSSETPKKLIGRKTTTNKINIKTSTSYEQFCLCNSSVNQDWIKGRIYNL